MYKVKKTAEYDKTGLLPTIPVRFNFLVPSVRARMKLQRILVLGHDVIPVDGLLTELPLMAGMGRPRPDENSSPHVAQRNGDTFLVRLEQYFFRIWK